ncbi:PepSY domain-containing protein [Dyella sp. M7H15-1]|uniref:PepSY domain-containing protein n=1 Tax=Dyella sp. M7H15-1 TaxID=2501295 RepID=UPI001004DE61|nr:PepSY domain-containing protein [Dyella sp. M7H15-1]QAU23497.1 PepSY domain-containing protein [Dyella sp. M7H15-1]
MSASHKILKLSRQIHLYLGVFIASALLFFALTGGLQVFSLHETSRSSDYKPPEWLVVMAQLHKKQTTAVRKRPVDAETRSAATQASMPAINPVPMPVKLDRPGIDVKHSLPLKIFSALVALGLFISTLLGIYMAYRYTRKLALMTVLLLAGIVLPILLAWL